MCESWFYRRLEAYAFVGLSEGDTVALPGNIFGTGSVAQETIAHEAIHNITEWTAANMQVLFGVPVDSTNTRNLSDKLKQKGCGK